MRFSKKPPQFQAAFSLLELIIVVVLLVILTAYVAVRQDSSTQYRQDTVIEQLISSGRLAQQLSMNDSSRVFSLSISANQIDLLADGASFSVANHNFPLTLGADITLSPAINLSFDNLGATSGTTITVQGDTAKLVCFESSGFIHRC